MLRFWAWGGDFSTITEAIMEATAVLLMDTFTSFASYVASAMIGTRQGFCLLNKSTDENKQLTMFS